MRQGDVPADLTAAQENIVMIDPAGLNFDKGVVRPGFGRVDVAVIKDIRTAEIANDCCFHEISLHNGGTLPFTKGNVTFTHPPVP